MVKYSYFVPDVDGFTVISLDKPLANKGQLMDALEADIKSEVNQPCFQVTEMQFLHKEESE